MRRRGKVIVSSTSFDWIDCSDARSGSTIAGVFAFAAWFFGPGLVSATVYQDNRHYVAPRGERKPGLTWNENDLFSSNSIRSIGCL